MKNKKLTYCNPLSIPEIPHGTDDWCRTEHGMFSREIKPESIDKPDYRSISDPTVFYHDNKWYLYASYGMAWVSEDFCNFKHIRTEPYNPKYSPCITAWKGKYLLTSWFCPLYIGETPLGPFELMGDFIMPDGSEFTPCDPAIFCDDDGKLYLYAVEMRPYPNHEQMKLVIVGYELDNDDPRRIIKGPVDIIITDAEHHIWERHGKYNQEHSFGWCEGPHLLKHKGRYYLIYAAPDTCDSSYCMAVYYSDTNPLEGYVCQKKNPLTFHRWGIVSGAGHGCVEHGPNESLWAFYTIAAPYAHMYERRIGMDMVAVDENGELYCPFGVTDTPQYAPGTIEKPLLQGNSPKWGNLTAGVRPTASSCREGRDAIYATDESNLTFWLCDQADESPVLECDLSGVFEINAVRVYWREIGLDYKNGIRPESVRYLVEGLQKGKWIILIDATHNDEEKNIDYRECTSQICTKVRLKIEKIESGLQMGVIDFSVFGKWAKEREV